MTAETTLIISCVIILLFALNFIADSIRIYRHASRDKYLSKHEILIIILFSILVLGFGIFGYSHFHEKDYEEALEEFKKFTVYRDFVICHSLLFLFLISIEPAVLWEIMNDVVFALLMYIVLLPVSLFLAFLSYSTQLENFFTRHKIVTDGTRN